MSNKINPFIKDLIDNIGIEAPEVRAVERDVFYADRDKVIVAKDKSIEFKPHKDRRKFVKLFSGGIDEIKTCTPSEIKILSFIMASMMRDSDKVRISWKELRKFCGIKSKTTIHDTLKSLIYRGFIAPMDQRGLYFINPRYIFNGDVQKVINRAVATTINSGKHYMIPKSLTDGIKQEEDNKFQS